MVAKLNNHSFNEYPADGRKHFRHCTITTCVNIHFAINPQKTHRAHTGPKILQNKAAWDATKNRGHVFETETDYGVWKCFMQKG